MNLNEACMDYLNLIGLEPSGMCQTCGDYCEEFFCCDNCRGVFLKEKVLFNKWDEEDAMFEQCSDWQEVLESLYV